MIRIDDALFKAPGIMLGNKLFIYTLCRLLAEETGYDLQTDPVRLVRSDSKEADRIIKFDDRPGKMTFLSKADKIYWPVTTIGPNQRKDPMVNLFVDDEDRYIKIPVNNSRSTSISCGDEYETN